MIFIAIEGSDLEGVISVIDDVEVRKSFFIHLLNCKNL